MKSTIQITFAAWTILVLGLELTSGASLYLNNWRDHTVWTINYGDGCGNEIYSTETEYWNTQGGNPERYTYTEVWNPNTCYDNTNGNTDYTTTYYWESPYDPPCNYVSVFGWDHGQFVSQTSSNPWGLPPLGEWFFCNISGQHTWPDGTSQSYTRYGTTTLKVSTGPGTNGKPDQLLAFQVGATEWAWDDWGGWWPVGPIPPSSISIQGTSLDCNGRFVGKFANNSVFTVTPVARATTFTRFTCIFSRLPTYIGRRHITQT